MAAPFASAELTTPAALPTSAAQFKKNGQQTKAEQQALAQPPVKVPTPSGTLAIQLVPAPVIPTPPIGNPAIVVPIVTFIGVLATIAFGWWKTRVELRASAAQATVERTQSRDQKELDRDHAAEQARRSRITTARREVYLELIREISVASMALSGLPQQKGDEVDVQSGFADLLSVAARVGILGEMNTVVKSRELAILVQEVLFKMMPAILHMRMVKAEQVKYDKHYQEQLALIEQLKQPTREALARGEQIDLKSQSIILDSAYAQAEKYIDAAMDAQRLHFDALQTYQHAVICETGVIAEKVNELIVCIRTELELETDADVLVETSRKMYESSLSSLRGLKEAMHAS